MLRPAQGLKARAAAGCPFGALRRAARARTDILASVAVAAPSTSAGAPVAFPANSPYLFTSLAARLLPPTPPPTPLHERVRVYQNVLSSPPSSGARLFWSSRLAKRASVASVGHQSPPPPPSAPPVLLNRDDSPMSWPNHEVSEPGHYPEGKPTWEHLQHIAMRLSVTAPHFFGLRQDLTFYREDLVFDNHINNIRINGLRNYWKHLAAIIIIARMRSAHCQMKILSITPILEDGTVRVRWRVEHISVLEALCVWKVKMWDPENVKKNAKFAIPRCSFRKYDNSSWFDGYSTFCSDGNGFVFKHVAERVRRHEEPAETKVSLKAKLMALGLMPKAAMETCSSRK